MDTREPETQSPFPITSVHDVELAEKAVSRAIIIHPMVKGYLAQLGYEGDFWLTGGFYGHGKEEEIRIVLSNVLKAKVSKVIASLSPLFYDLHAEIIMCQGGDKLRLPLNHGCTWSNTGPVSRRGPPQKEKVEDVARTEGVSAASSLTQVESNGSHIVKLKLSSNVMLIDTVDHRSVLDLKIEEGVAVWNVPCPEEWSESYRSSYEAIPNCECLSAISAATRLEQHADIITEAFGQFGTLSTQRKKMRAKFRLDDIIRAEKQGLELAQNLESVLEIDYALVSKVVPVKRSKLFGMF